MGKHFFKIFYKILNESIIISWRISNRDEFLISFKSKLQLRFSHFNLPLYGRCCFNLLKSLGPSRVIISAFNGLIKSRFTWMYNETVVSGWSLSLRGSNLWNYCMVYKLYNRFVFTSGEYLGTLPLQG